MLPALHTEAFNWSHYVFIVINNLIQFLGSFELSKFILFL